MYFRKYSEGAMPGNHRSGDRPKRKPPSMPAADRPVKPRGLDAAAAAHWDRMIRPAVHLSKVDADLARTLCELWSLYRVALAKAQQSPTERDVRVAVLNYQSQWRTTAERLCLDPLGRLRAEGKTERKDKNDPLEEFGIVG